MASAKKTNGKVKRRDVDVDDEEFKYTKGEHLEAVAENWLLKEKPDSETQYGLWCMIVTTIAFAVRFYKIWSPKEVVFDEVHFGKFASYYLERTFFFDVHPPFAKMMIAFIGWLCGYDGSFKFEDIGLSYETHPAPYLAYRSFNAILGTLTVPIIFNTLKELNFKATTCAFGALLVAIDNAHVIETRLILLDAILIIAVAATFYCYVRFYKEQLKKAFSLQWYIWLYLTGLSLSFVISTKYIGVMTYAAIGIAVAANLWQLLDIRSNLTLPQFMRHVSRRLNGLILVPFVIYLFWFYVHFAILNTSGPGDAFMSAEFQETLADSPATINSREVNYFDIITLQHSDTKAFLHSHLANYPLRYEDGRISSQGQQVTGYLHEDINNECEIVPTMDLPSKVAQKVLLDDVIRLRHVATGTWLLTHDVASPLFPTNEEVTAVDNETANGEKYQKTLFSFQPIKKGDTGHVLKSQTVSFRIFHVDTSVALWTHNDEFLPEWGFQQQEVNGNKKLTDAENNWIIANITNLDESRLTYVPKVVKKLPFFKKWIELQKSMFEQNNKLSSEHPFASQPQAWPGSLSGVSFWTNDSEKRQIFFTGNIVGFWFIMISLSIYVGIVITDLVTRQRSYFALNKMTREKLYGPLAFFFVGWACHYLPFFLMARQKFLHHYLPAHLIGTMFTAALWETIFTECHSLDAAKDEEIPGAAYDKNPKVKVFILNAFLLNVSICLIAFFVYFAPLVYGEPMTPQQVVDRQWFDIKLNFAK